MGAVLNSARLALPSGPHIRCWTLLPIKPGLPPALALMLTSGNFSPVEEDSQFPY